jgi:hypothetical protein
VERSALSFRHQPLVEEPAGLNQGVGQRRWVLPDIMARKEVRRQRCIKAVLSAGVGLHLQQVPVRLDRIAPAGTAFRWGPIVGIADQD